MQKPVWSALLKKKDLPKVVVEAIYSFCETRLALSSFHSAFAWGWEADDYTHVVVVLKDGTSLVVEGSCTAPTLVKFLS